MKCALCRRTAEHLICNNCWNYAVEKLQDFPKYYYQLESELVPSKGRVSERVGGSKEPPLPVRLEDLYLRSGGISKPLMKHESNVRSEQKHTKITFRGQELNKIQLTCTYLTAQSDWIFKNYIELDLLAKEINDIHKRINIALGNKSELITIGTCPTLLDDGEMCGAKLQINPATLTSFGDIKCKVCNTVWASNQWRLLGKVLSE